MDWNSVKKYFEYDGALINIYYEEMSDEGWLSLFNWLRLNKNLESVNYYDPTTKKNIEHIPNTVANDLNQDGFYCFVFLNVEGISMSFRYYEKSELECDISPKDIDSETKLRTLLNTLASVQKIVSASRYLICPENYKKGTFNINGEFVSKNYI